MSKTVALLAALALAGCDVSATEIFVVVDTDLSVPGEIDAVRVEVSGTESLVAEGSLTADGATLPRTVSVQRTGGSYGPIEIRAVGSLGGSDIVERTISTSFLEGQRLVLPMFLAARCRPVTCPDGQTCADGQCASNTIDPAELARLGGDPERLDGGCIPGTERCNGMDDDCDGFVDETFDLDTDEANCGSCGQVCELTNATVECRSGRCALAECEALFGDCNGRDMDGCERALTSSMHCGACGTRCEISNGAGGCETGTCAIASCNAGFADCDGLAENGCETPTTTATDCGACGVECAVTGGTPSCAGGSCVALCSIGLGDCDADPTTCETSLRTATDCGTCGTACEVTGGAPDCSTGSCAVLCNEGFGDCDRDPLDCETPLNTLDDCAACGTACVVFGGSESCSSGTCALVECDANRGDCNMDSADGCETNLNNTNAHCGGCDAPCASGTSCTGGTCS